MGVDFDKLAALPISQLLERCLLLPKTHSRSARLVCDTLACGFSNEVQRTPTHSIYFVEMVIFPSQRLKDFSLTILTNSLYLCNETTLLLRSQSRKGVSSLADLVEV
jgi:hypothetical protein